MVDYLAEIPLPGRMLASSPKNLAGGAAAAVLPSFVAGPENRLVATTVNRMLASLGETRLPVGATLGDANFQPTVFALFGPSGVGKTHLAEGLVRHWQRAHGDDAALYATAADFRQQYYQAMDLNRVEEFRGNYRGRRLLAIDDIHRLPSDDYLLQEFRHTLDGVEDNGGLLVVTSPGPADTLSNLPADIRSRLNSGLSLQLAAPGNAARVRIIRYASTALGRDLALDDAGELAERVTGTVTEVFGVLFDLWATAGAAATSAAVAEEHLLSTLARRGPTLQEIIGVVAKYTHVPQKQMKGASRRQSIVFARAIAVYLARELSAASYDQIGRALGGRDHTTIMHNYRKIEREMTTDFVTQQAVADLRRMLSR